MKQPDPVIAEPEQVQPDDMRACPLCGSREVHFLWHVTDKKFRGPGRFAYWRCAGCGLAMLHPRLSEKDLAPYYPDYVTVVRRRDNFRQRLKRMVAEDWYGYGSDRPDVTGWLRKAATFPLRRLLSQLPYKRPGGRVLDIGCGSGGYLAFLADLGWTCEGIEQGPNSRRYAQQELGLTVHSDLRQLQNFPDRCFDVVTMWHVIEHLADPFETLGAVHRVLKPGGLLMLRTPNADSWEARLFQGRWYGVDAPRHLYLFSPGCFRQERWSGAWHGPDLSRRTSATSTIRSIARAAVCTPWRMPDGGGSAGCSRAGRFCLNPCSRRACRCGVRWAGEAPSTSMPSRCRHES
jgi:2-polyprenyl-3-methyl-5-hydroxy-6-metoxy-1,4-benzoquinol methylase